MAGQGELGLNFHELLISITIKHTVSGKYHQLVFIPDITGLYVGKYS